MDQERIEKTIKLAKILGKGQESMKWLIERDLTKQ